METFRRRSVFKYFRFPKKGLGLTSVRCSGTIRAMVIRPVCATRSVFFREIVHTRPEYFGRAPSAV